MILRRRIFCKFGGTGLVTALKMPGAWVDDCRISALGRREEIGVAQEYMGEW